MKKEGVCNCLVDFLAFYSRTLPLDAVVLADQVRTSPTIPETNRGVSGPG